MQWQVLHLHGMRDLGHVELAMGCSLARKEQGFLEALAPSGASTSDGRRHPLPGITVQHTVALL